MVQVPFKQVRTPHGDEKVSNQGTNTASTKRSLKVINRTQIQIKEAVARIITEGKPKARHGDV